MGLIQFGSVRAKQPESIARPSPAFKPSILWTPTTGEVIRPQPSIVGSIPLISSRHGKSADFTSAITDNPCRRLSYGDAKITTGAFTIISAFTYKAPATRANRGIFSKYLGFVVSAPVSQRSYALNLDLQTHASDVYIRGIVSGNGSTVAQTPTGVNVTEGQHTAVSVYVPSTRISTFLDGSKYGENTTSIPSSTFDSTASVFIGAAYSIDEGAVLYSQYGMSGSISLVAMLPYAVSDRAAAELTLNPWQLFAPRRILVSVPAASGPPTLAAIAASNLTASGARLTVT